MKSGLSDPNFLAFNIRNLKGYGGNRKETQGTAYVKKCPCADGRKDNELFLGAEEHSSCRKCPRGMRHQDRV